jgi:uncharacterized membrane protein
LFAFSSFVAGPVALTVAIMNLNTALIFLFSYLFFKDKPTRYTIAGTVLMILGVILIKSSQ